MGFFAGQNIVRAVVGDGKGIGESVVVGEADVGHPLAAPERIDGQVVGNAANPGGKLALFVVAATFQGVNGLDEGVLQQVLGHVLVAHDEEDGRERTTAMPLQQDGEGGFLASQVKRDERGVARLQKVHKGLRIRGT